MLLALHRKSNPVVGGVLKMLCFHCNINHGMELQALNLNWPFSAHIMLNHSLYASEHHAPYDEILASRNSHESMQTIPSQTNS